MSSSTTTTVSAPSTVSPSLQTARALASRQPPHVVLGRLVRLQGLIDVSRPRGKLDPGVRENLLPPRRRGRESDEEIGRYRADLEEILTYVEKLNELDTSNVEPMAQVIARRRESPDANGNSEGMLKVRSRLDEVSLQNHRNRKFSYERFRRQG